MHIRIILKFFEKYKCSSIVFLLQNSRYVSNEQPCLKATGLYDDVLFWMAFHCPLVPFTFSVSCSVLLFHRAYFSNFSTSVSSSSSFFFFFDVLYQAFIKCSRKALVYIYINMHGLPRWC